MASADIVHLPPSPRLPLWDHTSLSDPCTSSPLPLPQSLVSVRLCRQESESLVGSSSKLFATAHIACTSTKGGLADTAKRSELITVKKAKASGQISRHFATSTTRTKKPISTTAETQGAKLREDDHNAGKPRSRRKPMTHNIEVVADLGGSKQDVTTRKVKSRKTIRPEAKETSEKEQGSSKARTASKDHTQTRLKKARVTKNIDQATLKANAPGKAFNQPALPGCLDGSVNIDHGLLPALRRRDRWTPPPIAADIYTLDDIGNCSQSATDPALNAETPTHGTVSTGSFGSIIGTFAFVKTESSDGSQGKITKLPSLKRKRIDIIATTKTASEPSKSLEVPKKKAIKKKPRTITELATAAYDTNPSLEDAPIMQYLGTSSSTTLHKGMGRMKPRMRDAEVILLSPNSAIKQQARQDFIFGTSSQLAREQSPTLLRDLHDAMIASNAIDETLGLDDIQELDETAMDAVSSKILQAKIKSNLWSAASRDEDGKCLEVDLSNDEATKEDMIEFARNTTAGTTIHEEKSDDPWHDIDDSPVSVHDDVTKLATEQRPESSSEIHDTESRGAKPLDQGDDVQQQSKSRVETCAVQHVAEKHPATRPGTTTAQINVATRKPLFETYTDAQLSKQVAKYRFKPVKTRKAMINILERCWEGEQHLLKAASNAKAAIAHSTDPPSQPCSPARDISENNSAAVPAEVTSPVKRRGRPRKDKEASGPKMPEKGLVKRTPGNEDDADHTELDSDVPLATKRTTSKGSADVEGKTASQPLPARPDSSSGVFDTQHDSSVLSPIFTQDHIFKSIGKAITSAERSLTATEPSWHERILLYDPIVLEDLTIWLNTGALSRIGYDGEVDPREVKKWCESQSICCLWRENLRGGARSRY